MYRIAASPRFEPLDTSRYHWFDGDGMVVVLFLRDGEASVHNRYVETAAFAAETKADRALYPSLVNGGARPVIGPDAPPFRIPPTRT